MIHVDGGGGGAVRRCRLQGPVFSAPVVVSGSRVRADSDGPGGDGGGGGGGHGGHGSQSQTLGS